MRFYRAYGMEIGSTFPLAGMRQVQAHDGPVLRLDLVDRAELDARWSGSGAPPLWDTQLGDGQRFSLERGDGGDVRYRYSERALFHLDAQCASLACCPTAAGLSWQRALLDTVLTCVLLDRGGEAVHAAAVEGPRGAVAVIAASGGGKTTFITELMRRGHALLCDDVLSLSRDPAGGVVALPGPPLMNVELGFGRSTAPAMLGTSMAIFGREAWVTARRQAAGPLPVAVICLLRRGRGVTTSATVLPGSPIDLLGHALRLSSGGSRSRTRFDLYSDLAATATVVELCADAAVAPTDLADLLEHAAGDRIAPIPLDLDAVA